MKSKTRLVRAAFSIVAFAACGMTHAEITFPVPAPTPEVGQVWKYRVLDGWNGKELRTTQSELLSVEDDRFITRFTTSQNPTPRTNFATKQWGACRSMRNSDQLVCNRAFSFPMQIGDKHSFEKLPWPNGNGYFSADCEVTGEEKVSVPGGMFDTVNIQCSGTWTRVFDGSFSGRYTETLWYAPSVSRFVKDEFITYFGNSKDTHEITELTEFKAKDR